MPLQSTNPATGELLRTLPTLTDEALRARVAQAAEAAAAYRAVPLEHRALWLRKLGTLLLNERDELARTVTLETGTPITAARTEITRCAEACAYYAEHGARLLAPELLQTDAGQTGSQAYTQWSPLGVVLAVMPWESPFWQPLRFTIPTLLAGNCVLLKHAPTVPQCALLLESLLRRAGFPRGVFTSLLIEERQVEAVLADEHVTAVTVTGTEAAGRALGAQAGWLLKKSALHLPGCDPLIVMPSADLDAAVLAATRAVAGAGHSGAAKRLVVHSGLYSKFAQRLVEAVEALRIGDPLREETEVGPLGTPEALRTLTEQVNAAVGAGGRVLTGGSPMVGRGSFFEPTLLADVPRTSAVARDALLGPVALLFRARDLDDAIALANSSPYGLGASLWTNEPAEQQHLIASVEVGAIALNALPGESPRLPFGGTKRSGFGRELGALGMREFLQTKTVTIGS